jgi:hypothetical protein
MWFGVVAATLLVGAGAGAWYVWTTRHPHDPPAPPLLDVASAALPKTVIVPTLDTPIQPGHSAVWCSSFQLAWNRLKADVAKGPVQLTNAQAVADRLNQAGPTEADLDGEGVYAAAGLVKDGIVERIRAEMGEKFPNGPKPGLNAPAGAVAYAYLTATVKFEIPFFENDEPFLFTDSAGGRSAVRSFGIRKKDDYAYQELRKQVQVLYRPRDAISEEGEIGEFVLDPCKSSSPYQVVLALVKPAGTLAATLADVQKKTATGPKPDYLPRVGPNDTLLIPGMNWRITHRFKELEGADKRFRNPALRGLHLDTALQTIQFKLDKSGADLAAEAKLFAKPSPTHLHFNRPFLLYTKKRDARHPFLVVWVDNAGLLCKQ